MGKPLNVAMIGTGFMGRAHSNAWMSVNKFFDLPREVVMHTVCGTDADQTSAFAERWGWKHATADVGELAADGEIDLVDVATPNDLHRVHTTPMLEAGKHVACEKPMAGTLQDARVMRDAARSARSGGSRAYVWFNYRRCPAVAYARQLVAEGRLGRLYHVRAQYLQDWGAPATPMSWRFDRARAGSGAHGDLNAHIVDMSCFVTGDDITEITGAMETRFIDRRPMPRPTPGSEEGASSVDDCVMFLARFRSEAVGSFEATRLATGNLNRNRMEINGELGALRFDFERMNELEWFDNSLDPGRRGWSTIMCTTAGVHPYVDAHWPPGHGIGYEHQFISQAADIVREIDGGSPVVALPDFEDAYRTQCILEAVIVSARQRRSVPLADIID